MKLSLFASKAKSCFPSSSLSLKQCSLTILSSQPGSACFFMEVRQNSSQLSECRVHSCPDSVRVCVCVCVCVCAAGVIFRSAFGNTGCLPIHSRNQWRAPSQGQNVRTVGMQATHFCMFPHCLEWDPRLQETHL